MQGVSQDLEIGCPILMEILKQGDNLHVNDRLNRVSKIETGCPKDTPLANTMTPCEILN